MSQSLQHLLGDHYSIPDQSLVSLTIARPGPASRGSCSSRDVYGSIIAAAARQSTWCRQPHPARLCESGPQRCRTFTVRNGSFSPGRMILTVLPKMAMCEGSRMATMLRSSVEAPAKTFHDLCCTIKTRVISRSPHLLPYVESAVPIGRRRGLTVHARRMRSSGAMP